MKTAHEAIVAIRAEVKRLTKKEAPFLSEFEKGCIEGNIELAEDLLAFLDILEAEEKADRMADALNAPFPEGVTDEQIIVQVVERNLQKDVVAQTAGWVLKESLARREAEQPVEGLEEEIDAVWNPRFNLGWDEHSCLTMNRAGFESIARHFSEWGAEHMKK